ncbi:alpha/beta fold hydrolase [Jiella mangrovi]|uniref:Alpha/beta hydrolase n=1 Tax=Jiella mangrovi TaxID=2821407 RepID=A0ABS4BHT9_9HYPH|nr:alpha/beta hydrolase [Jiella mangrovi]MBP0616316.1 alpha/beta hydrolase [Jiella mangrovi]
MSDIREQPKIFEVPGNPAPKGLVVRYLTTSDRKRLRYAISKGENSSRGTVLLLQGRNESLEKYFETMVDLNARGFAVVTFDWRGQGGSERLIAQSSLGHVKHIGQYLIDVECMMQEVVLPDCRAPYNILAHSMGGLIALHASSRLVNQVERLVLLAPLIGFAPSLPSLATLDRIAHTARWLGLSTRPVRRSIPGRLPNPADNPLTSDLTRYKRNRLLAQIAPDLFVDRPTVAWLASMTRAMRRLESSAEIAALSIPSLFVIPGADQVVSPSAAERLAFRMRCGSSLTIPRARHELLQEADVFREQALEVVDAYIGADASLAAE